MILIVLIAIPFIGKRKRKRRSPSQLQCLQTLDSYKDGRNFQCDPKTNSTCNNKTDDISDLILIQDVAYSIRDALSSIVRTRDFSVTLRQESTKCNTCVQWSVYDMGLEYGPFLVHSTIPKVLQPLVL